jgi:hypothetical protein
MSGSTPVSRAELLVSRRDISLLSLICTALWLQNCAEIAREAKQDYISLKSAISSSEIEITLKESFITNYGNRVTIDAPFIIDRTDRRPHPAFWDGDIHIAGRSSKIGLSIVAEIKNAAFEQDAIDLIHRLEGTGEPVRLAGAWRLWAEHVGKAPEVQGESLPPGEMTNPDHVFEIHPVTRVGTKNLLDSLRPVKGYSPGRAQTVFASLENIKCRIVPKGATTGIVTTKGQFNDVEFLLEIAEDQRKVVEDGSFVNTAVLDLNGNRLAENVRMVFLKDTPPERAVSGLRRGDRLHVVGLPRINLSTVASRTKHSKNNPELRDLNLPYEIIVVGVYPDRS